mgnify:CR=1 FL=1
MVNADRWNEFSFPEQMGNIASEISRAIRFENEGDEKHRRSSLLRVLEIIPLTIDSQESQRNVKELCRLHEIVADWLIQSRVYSVEPVALKNYALGFVKLRKENPGER